MVTAKKDMPVLALVFADGEGRDESARKMLSDAFPKVVSVRTSEEGIWTVRRIAAGGERVGFFLFDSSIPEYRFSRWTEHLHFLKFWTSPRMVSAELTVFRHARTHPIRRRKLGPA